MPTRSGKPYKDPKRKKEKDVMFETTNTPIGKSIKNNTKVTNMSCNRDIRVKRSNRKRSLSLTNVDTENAAGSKWIVSDLSSDIKENHSIVNDNSLTSNNDSDCESKASSRNLRRKKSNKNVEEVKMMKKKRKVGKEYAQTPIPMENAVENNGCQNNHVGDIENDLNSANIANKQIKKKKKVKSSKKKRGKSSHDESVTGKNEQILNNSNSSVNNDFRNDFNYPHSPNNYVRMRPSNLKDSSYDKEDTALDETENGNTTFNIKIHNEGNPLNYDNIFNKLKKKNSCNRISINAETQDNVLNATYEKKEAAATKNIPSILGVEDLNADSAKFFRGIKSDKTSESEDKQSRKGLNINTTNRPSMSEKRKSETCINLQIENTVINTTYEKDKSFDKDSIISKTKVQDIDNYNVSYVQINRKSIINDTTFEKEDNTINVKDTSKETVVNAITKDNEHETKFAGEKEKRCSRFFGDLQKVANTRKSSTKDTTLDKSDTSLKNLTNGDMEVERVLSSSAIKRKSARQQTIDFGNSVAVKLDSTFDIISESKLQSEKLPVPLEQILNTTFDKDIEGSSKSSLISSDNSDIFKHNMNRISITSDDSEVNIMNTSPIYIESSIDESKFKEESKCSPSNVQTPLKREGTFTKDDVDVLEQIPQTPGRRKSSVITAAGCTPYYVGKNSQKKCMLNVTRSLEKRMSVELAPRLTKVMFCSPINNPCMQTQEKTKIIKSNLKGSNKSFLFDEDSSLSRPTRKRSYTHSEADNTLAKRSRLTQNQTAAGQVSRPRTASATAKLTNITPKNTPTPYKGQLKTGRPRLPNFAALHQRQFEKMESLTEYKERKATRARHMLTPSGSKDMLERISPKSDTETQISVTKDTKDKTDTPTKKLSKLEPPKPAYTRFGFKLNLDVNPFSIPAKTNKPKETPIVVPPKPLPSLKGATLSKRENSFTRREAAKQAALKEKVVLEKRNLNRTETRTQIKGVRTNRRFELQMRFRKVV